MIQLSDLPYAEDALQPYVSATTLQYHHGKHHRAYVDKLNAAIADTQYRDQPLEAIILSAHKAGETNVFNNAAQIWNHSFLWHSMIPSGGGQADGELSRLIKHSFGGHDAFCEQFKTAATGQFGSGWAWLVQDGDALSITTTGNAGNPMTDGLRPLLTLDVWEHAYYLDFQNDRGGYVDAFLSKLVNWQFAARNLDAQSAAA